MARRYNPLAPLTPRQQRKQAMTYVNALVNPLMRQIESQFNRQLQGGSQVIAGYTHQLQDRLAPMAGQTQARYQSAQQDLAAIDNALANRLTAAGQAGAGQLGAQLSAANIPQSANIAGIGAGAAAAGAAKGSAAQQALVSQGAAASDYAAAQPGIAGLQGGNTLRGYTAQLANQRQTAMEGLRSKVPGFLQQELGQIGNLEFQKATANLGFLGDQTKLATQQQQFNQRQQLQRRQQNISHQDRQASLRARQQAATGKTSKARQSAINTATSKAKSIFDAAVRPTAGAGTPKKGSLLVPGGAAAQKTRQANYYGTLKRVIGVVRPILSPYMSNAEIIRYAQGIANSYYNPGQYGRPGRGGKRKDAAAVGAAAAAKAVGSIGL